MHETFVKSCSASIAFFLLLAPTSGIAANIQRQVEVEVYTRMNAVMITKVTVGNINVQCGLMTGPHEIQPVTPFQADDDWLQNMTVYLFNRTARTIVAGGITLGFPELGDGQVQPQPMYIISLGRIPALAAVDYKTGKPLEQGDRSPLTFAPGQTLAIHVGDSFAGIRQTIERRTNLSLISKVFIYVGPFSFEDGMKWIAGCFSLPIPQKPGLFRCIPDKDYFPGDLHNNWPPGGVNGH